MCRQAIASAFPQFAAAPMSVAGRGWHSLAIDIDDLYIAKFPQGVEAETALRREASLLAAIRPHVTIPVPALSLHENRVLFSLHPKLLGERLERDDYLRLSVPQRLRLASDLAGFFAELHALPVRAMREAGAADVEWWDTRPRTLEPVWQDLPPAIQHAARDALEGYERLALDPRADVFGFFDAHGWNMAFDHGEGKLNGVFDFGDAGIGPREREFVQVSLTHPELARLAIEAYEVATRSPLDRRKVFLLTAAQRLSELAGALESGESLSLIRSFAVDWFRQTEIRSSKPAG